MKSLLPILGVLCAMAVWGAELYMPPQIITKLKTYYPDTVLVQDGRANCIIVHPDEPGYSALAADVAGAIKQATGAEVPVKPQSRYTQADRQTDLICLGQMNNSRLALDLYIFHYAACDDWFPGPEGYAVRTCCDPWGTGKNVIMLGGIDLDGVKRSVEQFKPLITQGRTLTIPRTIKIHFKGLDQYAERVVPAYLGRFMREFVELKALPYGREWQLIDCANYYFLTGRDEFAEMYAKMLRRWLDEYYRWTPDRQISTPKYKIPDLILLFDLMEESPLIPDDLKLEMTNLLYDYTSRMSVHGRISGLKPGILSPIGHHAVSASVVYGARYFKQYYPEADFERIDQGLASVEVGQQTFRNSNGVIDNDGGYTRYYPITCMELSLAMDNYDFFTSGNARKWMDYCMIIRDTQGRTFIGRNESWSIAAWYYKDPEYVWAFWWPEEQRPLYPECVPSGWYLSAWTYLPNIPARKPENVKQVDYLVPHPTNYEQINGSGKLVNVPRERSFHQLAMRTGLDPDDQYLRLDGINDGIANGGDGNAITWLTDGAAFLNTGGQWGGGEAMKWHNTCLVLRDGQMWDKLVALCDLQLAADLPRTAFVRSVMHQYNGTDWARNICWLKGKYWVVFDQLRALEPGDYSIFCQWMDSGETVDDDFRTTLTHDEHTLVLQAAGGSQPTISRLSDGRPFIRQAASGQMQQDDEPTFAHLLYAHPQDQPHAYSIKRVGDGTCLVSEPGGGVLIGVAPLSQPDAAMNISTAIQARCTMFALTADEISFAGFRSLTVGEPVLATDKPTDLSINLRDGTITVAASEPVQLSAGSLQLDQQQHNIQLPTNSKPFLALVKAVKSALSEAARKPATAAEAVRADYPHKLVQQWAFQVPDGQNVTVNAIQQADLDADGRGEVLLGTADGRALCLNADGSQRWAVSFAPSAEGKNAVNDVTVADFASGPCVLVGSDDQYLHCLDAAGNELWKFTGTGIQCTNQAPGEFGVGRYIEGDGEMMVVRAADINADGVKEILAGSRTFMHGNRRVFGTVWCLSPAGELNWHLYQSGGWITSISAFDDAGDGRMKIMFGTRGGPYGRSTYVCDNQGKLVSRQGGAYGEKFIDVGPAGAGGALRCLRLEHRNGTLEAYDPTDQYRQKWTYRAGGLSATGPNLADLDGDGVAEIVIGSDGGSLFCVREAEQPLVWRVNLAEPLCATCIAGLTAQASQIAAGTSMGGLYVVSAEGKPLARTDIGSPVTCLTATQPAADGTQSLIVGTVAGTVTVLGLQ